MSYHQFSSSGGSGVGQNKILINFDANIIFVDATPGLGSGKNCSKKDVFGSNVSTKHFGTEWARTVTNACIYIWIRSAKCVFRQNFSSNLAPYNSLNIVKLGTSPSKKCSRKNVIRDHGRGFNLGNELTKRLPVSLICNSSASVLQGYMH